MTWREDFIGQHQRNTSNWGLSTENVRITYSIKSGKSQRCVLKSNFFVVVIYLWRNSRKILVSYKEKQVVMINSKKRNNNFVTYVLNLRQNSISTVPYFECLNVCYKRFVFVTLDLIIWRASFLSYDRMHVLMMKLAETLFQQGVWGWWQN